jgi:transposase InsO family protein
LREQIAAFRYSLIAPIVSRQTPLSSGEIKHYFEEVSAQSYLIPGSDRTTISQRSLERYLSQYRKNGWEGLVPQERSDKGLVRISDDLVAQAVALRRERPERSVEQIIYLLEESNLVEKGQLAVSTLARHLRHAGASRKELLKDETTGFRRFEVEDAHVLWQSDAQLTLHLTDPDHPNRRKKVILFAVLDDYSRYILHGEFYWDEKLPRLEDTLKKAILRHGIPEQFYCDNGAVYSSSHLMRVCGKLGIHLTHSRPYRPQGRGKIEKFFRFIDTSFKPEAYEAIKNGQIKTLEELNQALQSWLGGYYHLRKHGGTGQAPAERLKKSKREPRRISVMELTEIFLWEEERKVDKAGCISLMGNKYEVDLELAKQTVILRYDPFDLELIQVWRDNKRYADARPLDLKRRYDHRVKPDRQETEPPRPQVVSFFQAAEQKRLEKLQEEPLRFASKERESQ